MVPISSVRISRVPTYSGLRSRLQNFVYRNFTFFVVPFQILRLSIRLLCRGPYPSPIMGLVWAGPISLATTLGITIVFFSSGYLDVSVPRVPLIRLYYSTYDNTVLTVLSSLIRISADLKIFAPPRSFSQLVTSFFGATYQGILRKPFVA